MTWLCPPRGSQLMRWWIFSLPICLLVFHCSKDKGQTPEIMGTVAVSIVDTEGLLPETMDRVVVTVWDADSTQVGSEEMVFSEGSRIGYIHVPAGQGLMVQVDGFVGNLRRYGGMQRGIDVEADRSVTVEVELKPLYPFAPQLEGLRTVSVDGHYTVQWMDVEGAERYVLEEASDSLFADAVEVYRGSGTQAEIEREGQGDYYFYRVRGENNSGTGPRSALGWMCVGVPEGMAYVPAGEFTMGSEEGDADERPVHTVYLDTYFIDQYEVTRAQYQEFMEATGRDAPYRWDEAFYPHPDDAVAGASWFDARDYCAWCGKRLPTEAEWEKAARGTDGGRYPWGDDPPTPERLNASFETSAFRYPSVGRYPLGVSPYGCCDMAGNVREWVADWYSRGYYRESPYRNPPGPVQGEFRVLRGGSFIQDPEEARCANRESGYPPGNPYMPYQGFRCAKDIGP